MHRWEQNVRTAIYTEAIGTLTPHLCPLKTQPVSASSAHFSVRTSFQYIQKDAMYSEHVPGARSMSRLFCACSVDLISSSPTSLTKAVACFISCGNDPGPA